MWHTTTRGSKNTNTETWLQTDFELRQTGRKQMLCAKTKQSLCSLNSKVKLYFIFSCECNSLCIIAGQNYSDCVCHHPLPVVVTDPCVLPRDTKQQVWNTHKKNIIFTPFYCYYNPYCVPCRVWATQLFQSSLIGLSSAQYEQGYPSDCIWQPSCFWLQLNNKLPTFKSLEVEGEAECWAGCGLPGKVIWFTMSVGKVLREFSKFPRNETTCSLAMWKPLSLLIPLISCLLPSYNDFCWMVANCFQQSNKSTKD